MRRSTTVYCEEYVKVIELGSFRWAAYLVRWWDKILIKILSEIFLVIDDFGEPGVHEKMVDVRELLGEGVDWLNCLQYGTNLRIL
jgi:hypothetical protein